MIFRKWFNMQLFAAPDGSQGGTDGHGEQSADQIAAAVLAAVEAQRQRVGDAVLRSMAEQYGMDAEELQKIVSAEMDKRSQQSLDDEVQAQIEAANKKVQQYQLKMEIAKLGAVMGLLDDDLAVAFIDKKRIVINEDGTVEGVQDELEALQKSKPYLFKDRLTGSWGQGRQGGAVGAGKTSTLHDALDDHYTKRW